jgi:hypothetical protein
MKFIGIMASLLLVGALPAQTIVNIDLTSNALLYNPSANRLPGVIGKAGDVIWNAVGNTNLNSNLRDENGVITGVSFQLTGNLVTTIAENDLPGTFRIAAAGAAGFFQSYAFLNNSGAPGTADTSSFTIGGLDAADRADLYLYATWNFAAAGSEFRLSSDGGATWTAWKLADGSPNGSAAAFSEGSSYVVFTNLAVHTNGTILGEWKTTLAGGGLYHRGPFNAVQIVAVAAPPAAQQQSLGFDAAGDLFLSLNNLPQTAITLVQENDALGNGTWTNRFALSACRKRIYYFRATNRRIFSAPKRLLLPWWCSRTSW